MLAAEDNIRKQVNRGEDCSAAAMHLMAMRVVMLGLIGERNRLGGEERLLNVDERLKLDCRSVDRRVSKAAPPRLPANLGTVRVKKMHQIKNPEPRFEPGTKKAPGRRVR